LQFFSNQTQFVDDLFSYLVLHVAPLPILHRLARQFLLARTNVCVLEQTGINLRHHKLLHFLQ
jgi:hypothetical protein